MRRRHLLALTALAVLGGCATPGGGDGAAPVLVLGATGRTGRLVVEALQAEGRPVRVFVRDAATAGFGTGVEIVTGDVRDAATLAPAMAGVAAVISALGSGEPSGPNGPEAVDSQGVRNVAEAAAAAGVGHVVLVSSMGATQEDHPLNRMFGNVLRYKLAGENALRASGVPYTIVRPGGLLDEPGGRGRIVFLQGDPPMQGAIPRADVARVCVAAIGSAAAFNRTFEIVSEPGAPRDNLAPVFTALAPDPL